MRIIYYQSDEELSNMLSLEEADDGSLLISIAPQGEVPVMFIKLGMGDVVRLSEDLMEHVDRFLGDE